MAIPAAKSIGEKVAEKVVEKRRALGRGLESLLPGGPRVVPGYDPTLAQNARKDGAPSGALAGPSAVPGASTNANGARSKMGLRARRATA